MFPNIGNIKGFEAVKLALQNRPSQKPSTECIIEESEICLNNNNSKFDQDHLLQTNGTATGAPNSCSYSDLANHRLDKLINNERINNFGELFFYGRYWDDCFVISNGSKERTRLHETSSEQDYLEKSKEYMAYLVARGHSPKKVKRTFENVGKMTRTEARVKKQRAVNKNYIIFPAEYNLRGPM